jgi:hypothetical protein
MRALALGRRNRPGGGGARLPLSGAWVVILAIAVLVVLLLLSRSRQRSRTPDPVESQEREEQMEGRETLTPTEERGTPAVNDEESGLLASRWFWRGVWALIAGLMLLLLYYEFFVLG